MVADVHQDIIHDGYARILRFINDMKVRNPDFIIQLGDFSLPRSRNQPFLDVWNEFEGVGYHVLGNHDMKDLGYTRQQTMDWWGMKNRYYSFDRGDFHFVVLDGNDPNPEYWEGYHRFVGKEQQEWLSEDLASTNKPTVVFIHQSLEAPRGGIDNQIEVRDILEGETLTGGQKKVIACFSGHHHTDYMKYINGIPYIQINSMSYKWVGEKYRFERFAPHIEQAYPAVSKTCPYKDPLYTMLTLDAKTGQLHLEGMTTSFISPSPSELEIPGAETITPEITARNVTF
jgi:calcineurin-like phosphoesterase family protein